jgi:hypothetical protein
MYTTAPRLEDVMLLRAAFPAIASAVLVASSAHAQDEAADVRPESATAPEEAPASRVEDSSSAVTDAPEESRAVEERQGADGDAAEPYTFGGWAEAYYAWNFNEPSNGITDLRGFDNRHNSFNLSNVVLDAQWDYEGVNGRISLQWGSTPATYYLAETFGPTLGTGVGAQSIELWQFVQQAFVGYRIPIGNGLNVQAGLFLSPIGPEGMAVKDNWNYSRSNLFYGLPFYHTGVRISYPIDPTLTVTVWGVNGWNTVLDNNEEKSLALQLGWTPSSAVSVNFVYFSGVEPIVGSAEPRGWRHTFDLNATVTPVEWLQLMGHIDAGFEPVPDVGTSAWVAGALYARVRLVEWLFVALRGDFFWDNPASNGTTTASRIFWPAEWVSSATATVDVRPHEHVSLRLEYRHDHAASDAYFRGQVDGDGVTTPFVRNATYQNTITVGTTAWF